MLFPLKLKLILREIALFYTNFSTNSRICEAESRGIISLFWSDEIWHVLIKMFVYSDCCLKNHHGKKNARQEIISSWIKQKNESPVDIY